MADSLTHSAATELVAAYEERERLRGMHTFLTVQNQRTEQLRVTLPNGSLFISVKMLVDVVEDQLAALTEEHTLVD